MQAEYGTLQHPALLSIFIDVSGSACGSVKHSGVDLILVVLLILVVGAVIQALGRKAVAQRPAALARKTLQSEAYPTQPDAAPLDTHRIVSQPRANDSRARLNCSSLILTYGLCYVLSTI